MRVKVNLITVNDVENFVNAVRDVPVDVRLKGRDENGSDWDISGKSLLASLIVSQKEQLYREHTAHEVDWNTIWCECKEDIYNKISDFVIV